MLRSRGLHSLINDFNATALEVRFERPEKKLHISMNRCGDPETLQLPKIVLDKVQKKCLPLVRSRAFA